MKLVFLPKKTSTAGNPTSSSTHSNSSRKGIDRRLDMERMGSLFGTARLIFQRSGGEKGVSAAVLRGTTGADFESEARVIRSSISGVSLGCNGWRAKSGRKVRYVLIKGSSCFVFLSKDAPAPKYAISLAQMQANVQSSAGGHTTVFLESLLGDLQYKFIFDITKDKDIGQSFAAAISRGAIAAEEDIVKKRLGHEDLMNKSKSLVFAREVANKKVAEQPEAPVDLSEAMPGFPLETYDRVMCA